MTGKISRKVRHKNSASVPIGKERAFNGCSLYLLDIVKFHSFYIPLDYHSSKPKYIAIKSNLSPS